MQTRSKTGNLKPKTQISLLTSVSPIPKRHTQALNDPNWTPAMTDEYDAFCETRTWNLVPRPVDTNIVNCMWLLSA